MAGETVITVVGNLTADPELRTTGSGATLASFTIASTPRNYNRNTGQFEDGTALFLRCTAWRDMAQHCAESLHKGMRVIATGRLSQRNYQAQDGSNRSVIELTIDEIGPSLRYATATVTRTPANGGYNNRSNTNGGGYNGGYNGGSSYSGGQTQQNSAPAVDPWSSSEPASGSSFGSFGATEFSAAGDEPDF